MLLSSVVAIDDRRSAESAGIAVAISVAQGGWNGAHQRGRRYVRENAIVVDHDRRGQDVAEVAPDAEVAVVAIAGQAARAQPVQHGLDRELRSLHFGEVDRGLELERRERLGIVARLLELAQ